MPSASTPPDLSRVAPRPSSRLEQGCNGPRCLCLFLLVAALAAGNGGVALSADGLHRVAVTMLTLVAALAGLRTLRTGTGPPFVACLVLTALLVVVWHRQAATTTQDRWVGALTMVVDAYAIGLGVAFALLAVRLLSPLKATALVFSTASAIALGAVAFEVRDASRGGFRIESECPFPVGSEHSFRFQADGDRPTTIVAVCRHIQRVDLSKQGHSNHAPRYAAGFEFLPQPAENLRRVLALMAEATVAETHATVGV